MDFLRKDEDFFHFCEALHEERDVDHSSNSFFFFFEKKFFPFKFLLCTKTFSLQLSFLKSIYKHYDLLFGGRTFFKKKAIIHHLCYILFISIQNVRDFLELLHYVVCKHLADVLLKILLHKIDTCILLVAEPDINLGKYEQAYIDRR